jgi:hypothetical protein
LQRLSDPSDGISPDRNRISGLATDFAVAQQNCRVRDGFSIARYCMQRFGAAPGAISTRNSCFGVARTALNPNLRFRIAWYRGAGPKPGTTPLFWVT